MKNAVLYVFALLLVTGCSTEKVEPVGIYKNVSTNFVQNGYQFVFHKSMSTLNNTINLREDSTFEYSYCGGVEKGNWRMKGDSIYLVMETFKSIVDSIPIWEYETGKRVLGFEANGDELRSKEKINWVLSTEYGLMNWVEYKLVKVKKVSEIDY